MILCGCFPIFPRPLYRYIRRSKDQSPVECSPPYFPKNTQGNRKLQDRQSVGLTSTLTEDRSDDFCEMKDIEKGDGEISRVKQVQQKRTKHGDTTFDVEAIDSKSSLDI